jgi:hydrogenase/urease accessory protein HupE
MQTVVLHLANARFGDYYAGMFHLLSGIEYLMPVLALGLYSGQQEAVLTRKMLLSFVISLFVGVIVGFSLPEYTVFSLLCVLIFILLGALLALKKPMPVILAIALSATAGVLIGLPNGAAWRRGVMPINYLAGVLVTGGIIVLILAGLVVANEKKWQLIAVRVVGSWIAAIGIMYLPYLLMNN